MGVDCNILPGCFIQRHLLVSGGQIKLGELKATSEVRHQVWARKGVLVHVQDWVNCHLVVATQLYIPIALWDGHNRSCPITVCDLLQYSHILKPLQFSVYCIFHCKWHRSRLAEPWASFWFDYMFGVELVH